MRADSIESPPKLEDSCACQLASRFSFELGLSKDPRTIRQGMFGNDLAALNGQPNGPWAQAQERRCLGKIHPTLGFAFFRVVAGNVLVAAQ